MKSICKALFSVVVISALGVPAMADSATYQITVNTSSLSGQDAYLDLYLTSGTIAPTDDITAVFTELSGASILDNPSTIGTVSGNLSSAGGLVLETAGAGSATDYNQEVVLTNLLTLNVTLSGNGIHPAGGLSEASASAFYLSLFDPVNDSVGLLTSDPSGAVAILTANNDGTIGLATTPNQSGGQPDANITATPEPGSLSLFLCGLAVVCLFCGKRAALENL